MASWIWKNDWFSLRDGKGRAGRTKILLLRETTTIYWVPTVCRSCASVLDMSSLPESSQKCVCAQSLICFCLFVIPWTIACLAPLSLKFSRQEYWTELSFATPWSSQPRDQICVSCASCLSRQILYHWATWEAPLNPLNSDSMKLPPLLLLWNRW